MNGSAAAASITFSIYSSLGLHNFALVVCVFVFYMSGLCVNILLIVVICVESRLHRPMYVLLGNLALIGVVGSSSVCPHVIGHLMASRREVTLAACLTQVFFANVYSGCVFCILALMAYDRYVSICQPLLYHSIMTPAKLRAMLLLVYCTLSSTSAVQVYLTSRLRLCGHAVDKLTCDSLVVAHLSCQPAPVVATFGLCCALCVIFVPCFLVIVSYIHIFMVILKTSKESRKKALRTCAPHLVTFINFSMASFFGIIHNRLSHRVPKAVNVFTFMNFFVIPPLLHPIIYGIKMREIRRSIKKMLKSAQ